MFSQTERSEIRAHIIEIARADTRVSGGAITGSASVDNEDKWSDIDLAFGVKAGFDISAVLKDFTQIMYADHGAIHHLDVLSGSWIYRVFFLQNTLQVDVAVVSEAAFGARAPTFRLIFGSDAKLPHSPHPTVQELVGRGWLNALHVRSSLQRSRAWQTEHFIHGLREQVISLACLRHDLPIKEGRGVDRLPAEILSRLEPSLVKSIENGELRRAFQSLTKTFLDEVAIADHNLKARIEHPLLELAGLN